MPVQTKSMRYSPWPRSAHIVPTVKTEVTVVIEHEVHPVTKVPLKNFLIVLKVVSVVDLHIV